MLHRIARLVLTVSFVMLGSCVLYPTRLVVRLNSGGSDVFPFGADASVSGGTSTSTADPIVVSGEPMAAPEAVYRTARTGESTYTITPLSAGATYTVRLHFAELTATAIGSRRFDVQINGTNRLTDYDVFATAGGLKRAAVEEFAVPADASGKIVVAMRTGAAGTPIINGLEIVAPYQIDSGASSGAKPFIPDAFVTGGFTATTTEPIVRDDLFAPAATPEAVYQSVRWGAHTYTLPGLTSGASYRVRLHFVEIAHNAANQRKFDVVINGRQVLDELDVFALLGKHHALALDYRATANGSGQIVVALQNGAVGFPALAGLEVEPDPAYQLDAGKTDSGTPDFYPYQTDELFSGGSAVPTSSPVVIGANLNGHAPAPAAVYQTAREGISTYTFRNLTPLTSYRVRAHFAEIEHDAVGERLFSVRINGQQVLRKFDIYKEAGAENRAVIRELAAISSASGQIVVQLETDGADLPLISALEVLPDPTYLINAGGGYVADPTIPFLGDAYVAGGSTAASTASISHAGVVDPAPAAVYQTRREGESTYVLPDLRRKAFLPQREEYLAQYRVRLHFAETVHTASGQRRFDVEINGTSMLTDFDVFDAAGGANKAVVREWILPADQYGRMVVAFRAGSIGLPMVSGIEVVRLGGHAWAEADELFHDDTAPRRNDVRWRGGDIATSVDLEDGRVLWLFGDSRVDLVPPYHRDGSIPVGNTVGIQSEPDPTLATFTGYWRMNGSTPADFFPPVAVGKTFWPTGGVVVDGRLILFLSQWDTTVPDHSILEEFHVATVDDFSGAPDTWTIQRQALPAPGFELGLIEPGALRIEGSYLYLYGADRSGSCDERRWFVWRYALTDVAAGDFSEPAYWTGGAYTPLSQMNGDDPTYIISSDVTQPSVHRNAAGTYLQFQHRSCFHPLQMRTAPALEGPWSLPMTLHAAPENGYDVQMYHAYFWQVHPWLEGAGPRHLAMTYSTLEIPKLAHTDDTYYPHFVRVVTP